jgi:hypothetical protein
VIKVSFPRTAAGDRSGQLTIADNAPGSPHMVSLDGTGVASAPVVSISVSPSALSFGTQTQGANEGLASVAFGGLEV